MTTTNKTPKKRSSDEDDFDIVRQYILACPLVSNPTENAAVKAALQGLEQELKRRDRDQRLQKKFSKSCSTSASSTKSATQAQNLGDDEWEDIADDRKEAPNRGGSPEGDEVEFLDMDGETSFLGKKLAEVAILAIAESQARAKTPVAAIALALHAAMRSHVLGFACTGIADDSSKSSRGFAPPIRELSKTQFLPKDWDLNASSSDSTQQRVVLRYRKNGTGSVLLRVELVEHEISVKLLPANTKEPPSQSLSFPLGDHINTDSWTAAFRTANTSAGVEPALHYKGLPALMTAFAKTFDLGNVSEEKHTTDAPAPDFVEAHIAEKQTDPFKRAPDFARPIYVGDGDRAQRYERTPTIENAFPQRPMTVGDFAGDLGAGPMDPLRRTGPGQGGNLMGPQHPMFQGQGGGLTGVGDGSGFGMRPRFDPFGPPGGPQTQFDPNNPTRPGGRPLPPHLRPASGGDPNPDHLPPPNSLGGNMFT